MNKEKLNKLDLMNKKLNKDYLNLSNDYKILKEETKNLKSIIDEKNAKIYNYEKELSKKPKTQKYEKKLNYYDNEFGDNFEKKYEINSYGKNDKYDKYNYSNEKNNIYENKSNYYNDEFNNNDNEKYMDTNCKTNYNKKYEYKQQYNKTYRNQDIDMNNEKEEFNNDNFNNYESKKFMRNKTHDNFKRADLINEKNNKLKKGELSYLENYLQIMINERSKYEKEFNEIPKHPRTLKDIKLRNLLKDKIEHNEKEIINTQQQIKNLREC